jgi:Chromo (CHRromatin Organisation MOdifier) domain
MTQQVLLEGTNLKTMYPSAKLGLKRYGLFPIIDVISPVVYHLQLPPHWHIHNVFHASLLTPYKEMEEHGYNFTEPPPDLMEGEPEYEVEQIIDACKKGKAEKLEYLLRWKGYSPTHDS